MRTLVVMTAECFDATAFHLDSSAIPSRHRTRVYARLPCRGNKRGAIKETGVVFGNFFKRASMRYHNPSFYGRGLKFYSP